MVRFGSPTRDWVGAPFGNRPALRAGLPECGESRTETPEQEGLGSGNPTPSRSWLGLPECGESRAETPEQEGLGSGDPTPSRSWLGNRNSLARLWRATASSDS